MQLTFLIFQYKPLICMDGLTGNYLYCPKNVGLLRQHLQKKKELPNIMIKCFTEYDNHEHVEFFDIWNMKSTAD